MHDHRADRKAQRRVSDFFGLVLALVIFSLMPLPQEVQASLSHLHKLEQGGSFFIFSLVALPVAARFTRNLLWSRVLVLVFSGVLGGSLELAQGVTSLGRQAAWCDLGADMAGAAVGVLLHWMWSAWMRRSPKVEGKA